MEKTPQIEDLRGNSKAQFSLDYHFWVGDFDFGSVQVGVLLVLGYQTFQHYGVGSAKNLAPQDFTSNMSMKIIYFTHYHCSFK